MGTTFDAEVRWHTHVWDGGDFPEEDVPVIVTVENFEGERRTLVNILYKEDDKGNSTWRYLDGVGLWEKVVAWAEFPAPFTAY